MTAVAVHFMDENDVLRAGELVNPFRLIPENMAVEVEFLDESMIDVGVFRSTGEFHIFRTHISRVSSMYPANVSA